MKIKVSDLEANPYRNIAKYPIDRTKVDALKISIKETSFWDNILVRPSTNKGKYEIAYGHHRHIAIKEVGLKEIDVPCRELTNAQMVKIMAEENLGWNTSPAVINETVLATKRFLDAELAKFESWKLSNSFIKQLFQTEAVWRNTKSKGVGQTTILKFLGDNWKQWMVQNALATLKADALPVEKGGVDRKAIETLPNMEQANRFRNEVTKHKIPKPMQRKIAKRIVKEGIGSANIPESVRNIAKPEHLDRVKKKVIPTLDKFVDDTISSMQGLRLKLSRLRPNVVDIQSVRIHGHLFMECDNLIEALNKILAEKENVKKTG